MASIVTGRSAKLWINSGNSTAANAFTQTTWTHTLYGTSDVSFTFDRGTVEQELVGQPGNYFDQGALSIEGSFTNCRFGSSGAALHLLNCLNTDTYPNFRISCQIGTGSLSVCLYSAQVTSYEVAIGDADTISEASIDFTVMNPFQATYTTGVIKV